MGDYATVVRLVNNSSIDILLPHDQMLIEKKKGEIFTDFEEAPITFRPTYKFDTGTSVYDTSEKGLSLLVISCSVNKYLFRTNSCMDRSNSLQRQNYSDD